MKLKAKLRQNGNLTWRYEIKYSWFGMIWCSWQDNYWRERLYNEAPAGESGWRFQSYERAKADACLRMGEIRKWLVEDKKRRGVREKATVHEGDCGGAE